MIVLIRDTNLCACKKCNFVLLMHVRAGKGVEAEGEWDRACVRMDAMNEFAAKRIAASPFDIKGPGGEVCLSP